MGSGLVGAVRVGARRARLELAAAGGSRAARGAARVAGAADNRMPLLPRARGDSLRRAMRPGVFRVDGSGADSVAGRVVFAPVKAAWNLGMLFGALVLAPLTFSIGALLVFFALTYVTLLLGHSVGMHRRFIHRSYDCPKWLERLLVWLGTVVGMAGPLGILRIRSEESRVGKQW